MCFGHQLFREVWIGSLSGISVSSSGRRLAKAGFTQRRKGGKDAKKNGNEITALNFVIYGLLLCVFAPFASLRETTVCESRLSSSHTTST